MKKQDMPTKINRGIEKIKALTDSTIAACRQQGLTIQEMEDFITQLQLEVLLRKDELRKEFF